MLRPSDWRFFIAELAVGALYELEEEILDCGAIECLALHLVVRVGIVLSRINLGGKSKIIWPLR